MGEAWNVSFSSPGARTGLRAEWRRSGSRNGSPRRPAARPGPRERGAALGGSRMAQGAPSRSWSSVAAVFARDGARSSVAGAAHVRAVPAPDVSNAPILISPVSSRLTGPTP